MSSAALTKAMEEKKILVAELNSLKNAGSSEASAADMVNFMNSVKDPIEDPENEWKKDLKPSTCDNCVLM
jgi:hypothetical protein